MTPQQSRAMVDSLPALLNRFGPLNPVAYAEELTAEQLVDWLIRRSEFSFQDSVVGDLDGFLHLYVSGASFLFGAYGYPNKAGSFAMFLLIEHGDTPAQAVTRVQRLIRGGSVLMDLANISADEIPQGVAEIISSGAGLPLSR